MNTGDIFTFRRENGNTCKLVYLHIHVSQMKILIKKEENKVQSIPLLYFNILKCSFCHQFVTLFCRVNGGLFLLISIGQCEVITMFMHSNRIAPYANKFNNGYFRLVLCGIIVKNDQFKPVGQIHVFVRPSQVKSSQVWLKLGLISWTTKTRLKILLALVFPVFYFVNYC